MAQSKSALAAIFITSGVMVLAVLALLYVGESQREQKQTVPKVNQNDPHSEIASLEKMWKEHPNHAPIALRLGNLYAEQGQPEKAVFYYREFLKYDTSATGWEVRLYVAKALNALGRVKEAIAEVQSVLRRDPDHAGALYNLGALEANSGHPDQARTYWEQLIAKHPQDSLAQVARESLKQLK